METVRAGKPGGRVKPDLQRVMPVVILAGLLLALSLLNRDFLSLQTLVNLMQQVSAVGVVAIGAMFVIITGGIDFSAGYGLAMIGMAGGVVYAQSPLQGRRHGGHIPWHGRAAWPRQRPADRGA